MACFGNKTVQDREQSETGFPIGVTHAAEGTARRGDGYRRLPSAPALGGCGDGPLECTNLLSLLGLSWLYVQMLDSTGVCIWKVIASKHPSHVCYPRGPR